MINLARAASILSFLFILCINANAQNKVVVIPLGNGSSASSLMWAVVNGNGTLVRSSNGVTSSQLLDGVPTGDYAVVFDRDISGCAYQATAGRPGVNFGPQPGFAQVANWADNPTNGVIVFTRDQNGSGTESRGFHLLVTC